MSRAVLRFLIKFFLISTDSKYMKWKFFLYISLISMVCLQGCTRSARSDMAQIQIKLPIESTMLLSQANSVSSSAVTEPQTLDEINCFGLFVGGPDEDLRNKVCALGRSNESFDNHSGGNIVFGDWRAAIPAGQVLSMDVKSGTDRVIYLVGLKAQEGSCFDFREYGKLPEAIKTSRAYFLGVARHLELKPGEETVVNMLISLNPDRSIVGCRGDAILQDGGDANATSSLFN